MDKDRWTWLYVDRGMLTSCCSRRLIHSPEPGLLVQVPHVIPAVAAEDGDVGRQVDAGRHRLHLFIHLDRVRLRPRGLRTGPGITPGDSAVGQAEASTAVVRSG